MVKAGIVGLRNVGKSTLFNAVAAGASASNDADLALGQLGQAEV